MNVSNVLSEMGIPHTCKGNEDFEVLGLIESDVNRKICSFVTDEKFIDRLNDNVAVVLVTEEIADKVIGRGACIVDNPRHIFFQMHNRLSDDVNYKRKDYKTVIGRNCSINKMAYIAEKNVTIGDNVVIEEFVSIKENTVIGNNSIIRAGSIIGGSGFEQKRNGETVLSVEHIGGVIIGDDVEIQQTVCVDRAIYPWDNTEIGDCCRIDNLVHVAHAVKLKKRVLVAASTFFGGRTIVEDDVWIGPGVTLINGMHIEKNARVNIGSVATKNVGVGESVTGNFAIPHEKFIQHIKNINTSPLQKGGGTK